MPVMQAAFRGAKNLNKKSQLLSAAAIILFIGILVGIIAHTQTFQKATTHQPESYTELYFSKPNSLQGVAKTGQALPVAFTIHNVEARNVTYTYATEVSDKYGKIDYSGKQKITIDNGYAVMLNSNAIMPTTAGRYEVTIALIHKPETIHYWVEVNV
jgi:hypothetical protein